MRTVQQALDEIIAECRPLPEVEVPLDESVGLTLSQEVRCDQDLPPFDKAMMDGYAVRAADVAIPPVRLPVVEEITAGRTAARELRAGEAARIMTGSPLPAGADAVVRVEDTESVADNLVEIRAAVSAGKNRMLRGEIRRQGEIALAAGRLIRPQEIGALAELGCDPVTVRRRPRVAILATGDELVSSSAKPGPGQIRNSNEPLLVAKVRAAGADPVPLGIARDEEDDLRAKIEQGLGCELLILSGGVSAGKLDLVPAVLKRLGVRELFHKVRVKPGKPLWFGVREGEGETRCCVMGLPGNPVSSLVCFELFARTAIRRLIGERDFRPRTFHAALAGEHAFRGDRELYLPVRIEWDRFPPHAVRLPWQGSADLQGAAAADGFAVVPAGEHQLVDGSPVRVLRAE